MRPLIPWFEAPVLHIPIPGTEIILPLHGFGLLVAIGFIVGGRIAMSRARRFGHDAEAINRLIGWLVAGTFVGGHVGYGLMYDPAGYFDDPIQFLYVWKGLSSFGGFIVCVPLAIWFFYREKLPVWPYMDHLAHGMAIGWFFGRMGCFVAHDHPGTPTDFYLGVYGICRDLPASIACHDMGLYEALWSLTMFLLLVGMDRLRGWRPGVQVALFGLAYGPVRIVMDRLRPESTDPLYGGLTPAQWGSIVLLLACVGLLVSRLRSDDPPLSAAPEGEPEPATS